MHGGGARPEAREALDASASEAPGGGPMGVLIRGAARRAALARAGQALCVAAATYAATLALTVRQGAAISAPAAHAVALSTALAAGLAWRLAHRAEPALVARDVDRALAFDGALVAAYEDEAARPGTPLARLAAQRVLRAARPDVLREAALPLTLPFVAAPFAGFVLLAVAVSAASAARRGGYVEVSLGEAARGLAAAAGEARRESLGEDVVRALEELARDAATFDAGGSAAAAEERAELASELAARAEALTVEVAGASEAVRRPLEDAALHLEALAVEHEPDATERRGAELGADAPSPADAAGETAAGRDVPADEGGAEAAAAPSGASSTAGQPGAPRAPEPPPGADAGTASVTEGARPGTMRGSPADGERAGAAPGEAPSPLPEGPDAAPGATRSGPPAAVGRRWPAHLDPLVSRWQSFRSSSGSRAGPDRTPDVK